MGDVYPNRLVYTEPATDKSIVSGSPVGGQKQVTGVLRIGTSYSLALPVAR